GSLDEDCDGLIDEGCTCPDGDTQPCGATEEGACEYGTQTCSSGQWGECIGYVGPTTETCDNVDNDCDGAIDESLTNPTTCGVGACSGNTGYETCSAGAWGSDTCDPLDGSSSETCNNLDDDCDGTTDSEDSNCSSVGGGPISGGGSIVFQYPLTVTNTGTGSGTVTATGIDCGSDCNEPYNENTIVVLTANAGTDSSFAGWSGDCSGTETNCQVTMSSIKNVTATFNSTGQVLGEATSSEPQGEILGETTQRECYLYLFEYIKYGRINNPEEVKKLQIFLNEEMGSNLVVTGTYDKATREVVNQFQLKYKNEVLKPWVDAGLHSSIDIPTGYVYKTTKRWINLIKCPTLNIPMPGFEEDRFPVSQGESTGLLGQVSDQDTASQEGTEDIVAPEGQELGLEIQDIGQATLPKNRTWLIILIVAGAIVIGYTVYRFLPKKKQQTIG
ncbi:MAG: peptidoglycan-binding protein, partial [Candidatus Paceibacterota bacterium]